MCSFAGGGNSDSELVSFLTAILTASLFPALLQEEAYLCRRTKAPESSQ